MCFESAEMHRKTRESEEARRRKPADDLKRQDQSSAPARPHTWLSRVIQPALAVLLLSLAAEGQAGVSAGPSRVLVHQIRLVAGLLTAAGQGEMDPQKNLSGRLQLELRARAVQVRATLAVAGTLKNPQFRRVN